MNRDLQRIDLMGANDGEFSGLIDNVNTSTSFSIDTTSFQQINYCNDGGDKGDVS